jgi:ATP-dependent Zn protease
MTGSAAESLLAIFEDIQRMHQQDRQALIQELDALGPPQTGKKLRRKRMPGRAKVPLLRVAGTGVPPVAAGQGRRHTRR